MENIKALIQEAEELIAEDIVEIEEDSQELEELEENRRLLKSVFKH